MDPTGGMFFTSESRPYFVPEGSSGYDKAKKEEIKTDVTYGLPVRVSSRPSVLMPNEYIVIGTVTSPLFIYSLEPSPVSDRVAVYEGEFTLLDSNSYVGFPTSIKWDGESKNIAGYESVGGDRYFLVRAQQETTYRFSIRNGLGSLRAFSGDLLM